jgi:hypothetical protein
MRLLDSDQARRFVIPAFAVAFANLAALGLLIGYVGASRAYSVGLHTLFRDHLPTVVLAGLVALVLAAVFGRRLGSIAECALFLLYVFVADIVAGFLPILVFNEITRHPDLPRVLITETAGATQLLAAALGLLLGYRMKLFAAARRQRMEAPNG